MNFDVHMRVGDFSMFGTSLRSAGLPAIPAAYEIIGAPVFSTSSELARAATEGTS
jgi:hypothetical protein